MSANQRRVLFFDTETTGLPKRRNQGALEGPMNWPDLVEMGWMVYDADTGERLRTDQGIIRPDGWTIGADVTKIHGISHEMAMKDGETLAAVMGRFMADVRGCYLVVAHNLEFDRNVVFHAAKWRLGIDPWTFWPSTESQSEFCTLVESRADLPNKPSDPPKKKSYTLSALYEEQFGEKIVGAHRALTDVDALQRLFWARWDMM